MTQTPKQKLVSEIQDAIKANMRAFRNRKTGGIYYALIDEQKDELYDDVMIIPNISNVAIDYILSLASAPEVGEAVGYATEESIKTAKRGDSAIFGGISPHIGRTVPLYTTPQPDRTAQLEADNKRLVDVGKRLLFIINQSVPIKEIEKVEDEFNALIAEMGAKG